MFQYLLQRYQAPPQEVLEILELHQLAYEFQQEHAYREALEAYCDRYDELVQQHQQEHAAMQNEPNFFALFWRKRHRA